MPDLARNNFLYINANEIGTFDSRVWKSDLVELERKIYRIIAEHTKIDITEEEFMELLEE